MICTNKEQIYTVNCQLLLFCAKKYGAGWMGGWMGGWVDGWMGVKAGLRIAYSNQKTYDTIEHILTSSHKTKLSRKPWFLKSTFRLLFSLRLSNHFLQDVLLRKISNLCRTKECLFLKQHTRCTFPHIQLPILPLWVLCYDQLDRPRSSVLTWPTKDDFEYDRLTS